jgi:hypothetical protein
LHDQVDRAIRFRGPRGYVIGRFVLNNLLSRKAYFELAECPAFDLVPESGILPCELFTRRLWLSTGRFVKTAKENVYGQFG